MAEFIKTAEVVGNIAQRVYGVGKFVVERFQGGAWADVTQEVEPANIQVYEGNLVKGEE